MNSLENITINGVCYNAENLDLLLQNNPQEEWVKQIYNFLMDWLSPSDSIITHTSGSTGQPKEIRLTKQAMRNSAKMTNAFLGLDNSTTALLCLPASYIAGKMMIIRAITGKYHLICTEPKANPFESISADIDFTAITPYQLTYSAETLKSFPIKKIIVGGGHVNTRLEIIAVEIPAELYETYGMTETASHIALRKFNGEKSDYFTTLSGIVIHQDERGCLIIKAPHLTSETLITNDIVELINEKSFKWLGRIDSVINSGGIKIFPEQVEKKLEMIISEPFFVAAEPDEVLEQKVILIIECFQDKISNYKNLIFDKESGLSKYETPKEIYSLNTFCYSASNKILKKETLEKLKQHPTS